MGGLIEQNLVRDPVRGALVRPAIVAIGSPDDDAAVSLRLAPGRVIVAEGIAPDAQLRITAGAGRLLALTAVPLRLGYPDPLTREGRTLVRDVIAGRVRIRGMISHPIVLARLTMLLSVR